VEDGREEMGKETLEVEKGSLFHIWTFFLENLWRFVTIDVSPVDWSGGRL
jgi:hypothetical protein